MKNPLQDDPATPGQAAELPTLKGSRDYRVDADPATGAIFIWSLTGPAKILGCVFRHDESDAPLGAPDWTATIRDIIIARGVSRERAVGALVVALWEAGL